MIVDVKKYRTILRRVGSGRFEEQVGTVSGGIFKRQGVTGLFPVSSAPSRTIEAANKRAGRFPLQSNPLAVAARRQETEYGPGLNATSGNVKLSAANDQRDPPSLTGSDQKVGAISPKADTAIISSFRSRFPRIALVIGNAAYGPSLGSLPNPANDADAMATALTALGFQVEVLKDVDQKNMKRAIARFGSRLRTAGKQATGLFFYAGHGLQTYGINYLIPVNAAIEAEADVDLESVAADTVLKQMEEAGSSTNIVILDACRNMPLMRSLRSGTRGLARMDAPNGSFVAYSTAPGSVAADGTGRNSPFVTALIANMGRKGYAIEGVFRDVRRSVLKTTGGRQTPWDSSSLVDPFYFAGE